MSISVVIPTCNRRARLLSTLGSLDRSSQAFFEVIIVDSGEEKLSGKELAEFSNLAIVVVDSEQSVCIQRNIGISMARSPLIFLCDDDVEVPAHYVRNLSHHMDCHAEAGAVSGLFLQKEGDDWTAVYPLRSSKMLLWNYIFRLSIWGPIEVSNPFLKKIGDYYRRKGNHITAAGWPVLTDFSVPYFVTPLYSLGASLVKKDWLLASPFDEKLDAHGIGDNYGVAMGFPGQRVDVLTTSYVYHHKEAGNRLQKPLQYYRRAIALDYFIDAKKRQTVKRPWLLWSLLGNLLFFLFSRQGAMASAASKSIAAIAGGNNPLRRRTKAPIAPGWLWAVFAFYCLLLAVGMAKHEMWADEFHSWNISKGSGSYLQLIANRRFEGHPPGWYTLLWTLSKFTHRVVFVQVLQWLIAVTAIFLILFRSPLPTRARVLIPFGYYFLWEFGVFSRNYTTAILLAFCVCLIMRRQFSYKAILYYLLLFCLSNIHMLGLLLAVSLHGYFLLLQWEERPRRVQLAGSAGPGLGGSALLRLAGSALLGLFAVLPAVYFILPPADSQLNLSVLSHGASAYHFSTIYEMPIRAFLPLPAWWKEHFWNSHFLLASGNGFIKSAIAPIGFLLLFFVFFCLWKDKKSVALFAINLVLSFIVSLFFFSLLNARYSGFVYISFLVAYWLYCAGRPVADKWLSLVNLLLIAQLAGGAFAYVQDLQRPFSYSKELTDVLGKVPPGEKWVTDYWTMNTVVARTDRPAYCVDMEKDLSYILWASDIALMQRRPYRYTDGLNHLFAQGKFPAIYMITHAPLSALEQADTKLASSYRLSVVDSRVGAIDRGSDLYLYRIEPIQ
jgi:glycosyltransferase involved in cell wall biosynthesis